MEESLDYIAKGDQEWTTLLDNFWNGFGPNLEEVLDFIIDEKISQGHAKILVGLNNSILLAKKIVSKKISVRQTEALVRSIKKIDKELTKTYVKINKLY